MEKLAVFNEKGEILDKFIYRDKKMYLDNNEKFKIILIFIINSQNKLLIQKASQSKGGDYATTGGHVSYGDTSIQTVIKEVKEELGLEINQKQVKLYESCHYPKAIVDCYYVYLDVDLKNLILEKTEVESVEFCTIDQIDELINKNLFRKSNIIPYQKLKSLLKFN